jgi:hypothetical protein
MSPHGVLLAVVVFLAASGAVVGGSFLAGSSEMDYGDHSVIDLLVLENGDYREASSEDIPGGDLYLRYRDTKDLAGRQVLLETCIDGLPDAMDGTLITVTVGSSEACSVVSGGGVRVVGNLMDIAGCSGGFLSAATGSLTVSPALPEGCSIHVKAYAVESVPAEQSVTYTLNGSHLKVSGYGAIPDFEESPWTEITSLEICEGITGIGEYAFSGADLDIVELPDSLECIGDCAFEDCELEYVRLGKGVQSIGSGAFRGFFGTLVAEGSGSIDLGSRSFGFTKLAKDGIGAGSSPSRTLDKGHVYTVTAPSALTEGVRCSQIPGGVLLFGTGAVSADSLPVTDGISRLVLFGSVSISDGSILPGHDSLRSVSVSEGSSVGEGAFTGQSLERLRVPSSMAAFGGPGMDLHDWDLDTSGLGLLTLTDASGSYSLDLSDAPGCLCASAGGLCLNGAVIVSVSDSGIELIDTPGIGMTYSVSYLEDILGYVSVHAYTATLSG